MKKRDIIRFFAFIFVIMALLTVSVGAMINDSQNNMAGSNVPDSEVDDNSVPYSNGAREGAADSALDKASDVVNDAKEDVKDAGETVKDAVEETVGTKTMGIVIAILITVAIIILIVIMIPKNRDKSNRK